MAAAACILLLPSRLQLLSELPHLAGRRDASTNELQARDPYLCFLGGAGAHRRPDAGAAHRAGRGAAGRQPSGQRARAVGTGEATIQVNLRRTRPIQRPGGPKGWTVFRLPSTPGRQIEYRTPQTRRSSPRAARADAGSRSASPGNRTYTFPHTPVRCGVAAASPETPFPHNGAWPPATVMEHGRSARGKAFVDEVAGVKVAAAFRCRV